MWDDLLRALALVMVIEGLMPFLAPAHWQDMLIRVATLDRRYLRLFGGVMIGAGALLLQLFSQ